MARATALRDQHTVKIDSKDEFTAFFTPKSKEKPEIHGGFAFAHWDGTPETEAEIQRALAPLTETVHP